MSYQTPYFNLVTDLDRDAALYLLNDLESFRSALVDNVGVRLREDMQPLPILAVSDYKTFEHIGLRGNIGGVFRQGRAGYFALANVVRYRPGNETTNLARHTLLHEYFHFLTFFSDYDELDLPGWYIEGMAEYWATFRIESNKILVGDPQVISDRIFDLFAISRNRKLIDTRELMLQAIPDLTDDSEQGQLKLSRFYARSFFLVHYLNSSAELRHSTSRLIKELNRGKSLDGAFANQFSISFDEFDRNLKSYLSSNNMVAMRYDITQSTKYLDESNVEVSRLGKAERYHFLASMFWDSTLIELEDKERLAIIDNALKKNKNDPQLSSYRNLLLENISKSRAEKKE